jgi:hypothetical protein
MILSKRDVLLLHLGKVKHTFPQSRTACLPSPKVPKAAVHFCGQYGPWPVDEVLSRARRGVGLRVLVTSKSTYMASIAWYRFFPPPRLGVGL